MSEEFPSFSVWIFHLGNKLQYEKKTKRDTKAYLSHRRPKEPLRKNDFLGRGKRILALVMGKVGDEKNTLICPGIF